MAPLLPHSVNKESTTQEFLSHASRMSSDKKTRLKATLGMRPVSDCTQEVNPNERSHTFAAGRTVVQGQGNKRHNVSARQTNQRESNDVTPKGNSRPTSLCLIHVTVLCHGAKAETQSRCRRDRSEFVPSPSCCWLSGNKKTVLVRYLHTCHIQETCLANGPLR